MDRSLVEFIGALRSHDIRVSPAETLDAMECLRLVGFDSRDLLRESLSIPHFISTCCLTMSGNQNF